MASVWEELKRRNVFRVGIAYLAAIWVLIQVADIVLPVINGPSWIIPALVFASVVGFPLALLLAWFYEITPEGLRAADDVESHEAVKFTGRRIDFAIIGLLVLAVGFLLVDDFVLQQPSDLEHSIAVLPFANLGPDPESEYFADAMTDELIGRLGRIEGVQIMSRQSVARFKGTDRDIREIAAELGVAYVLEGSVRKAEDRARVTVQLTDASSGFEEWSDVFNDESDDWFALHEEMSVRIANALDLYLGPNEAEAVRAHYTEIQAAYDAFWRGWILLESFHGDVNEPAEKLRAAEGHIQRALALDPQYVLAVAGLSLVNSSYYFYDVDPTAQRRERGKELAQTAVAMNPNPPEVHIALGYMHGNDGNYVAAAEEFREALRRGPENSFAWCHLAVTCLILSPPDPQTAEAAAREAIRHDPMWPYSYQLLGRALLMQGRFEEALEAHDAGAELSPDYRPNHYGRALAYLGLGNYRDALSSLETAWELSETDEDIAEVLVRIGAAHAGVGEVDEGLVALEQGLERGFSSFDEFEEIPYFASLSSDPRFQALIVQYRWQ